MNVIIVGCGYWGTNLVRNFVNNSQCRVIGVFDTDENQRQEMESRFGVKAYSDFTQFELWSKVDLAVIATRPSSHFSIAKDFLEKSLTVLISKPCGLSSEQNLELLSIAKLNSTEIFCDLTYCFSPLIMELISNERLREITSTANQFVSYRTSLGIVQADVDVLADLLVHDLSILAKIGRTRPQKVSCSAIQISSFGQLESAFVTLYWPDFFTAAVHLSWNSPRKNRLISIVSSNASIQIEELNNNTPLQIIEFAEDSSNYESLSVSESRRKNVRFTMGNITTIIVDTHEPLELEVKCVVSHFLKKEVLVPLPTLKDLVDFWRIIEALRDSELKGGVAVAVQYPD